MGTDGEWRAREMKGCGKNYFWLLLSDRIRSIAHAIRSQIEDIPGWANDLEDIANELEAALDNTKSDG